MQVQRINAKLAGMRKPQNFVVYPFKPGALIMVQSDKCIGRFDPVTGRGIINWRGSNYKTSVHLSPILGAEEYEFPQDFVDTCIALQPQSGDQIGAGCYVA
jgi:hypothetical protein